MIGLNTSALQAKSTTTTAEQKFLNGKNQKSGWKGICVCLFSLYKDQIFLRSFKSSWAYLTDYCCKRLWSRLLCSYLYHDLWHLLYALMIQSWGRGEVWFVVVCVVCFLFCVCVCVVLWGGGFACFVLVFFNVSELLYWGLWQGVVYGSSLLTPSAAAST